MYLDRWLDVQVAPRDVDAQLRHLLAYSRAGGLGRARIGCHVAPMALRQLERSTERGREQTEAEESPIVIVYTLTKAGCALNVLPDHAVQVDR